MTLLVMKAQGCRRVQIQMVLKHAGFDAFHLTLNELADLIDCHITHGVVERFWDTTNAFHFPFGEMTITTPFGFTMLRGLGFTREPLVYHEDFYTHYGQLPHFLA